ncbi:MAG: MFS transporter [Acidobacteria bacterium]|nr:MFS transporter [Acidobacteriota bacterium]
MPLPVRYKVLGISVLLAAITYLDRICISMAAPFISKDLNLTDIQMGYVFSAFTLAYAIFEIPTGAWGDKVGTRKVLTRIVLWWSAFTCITGAAFSYVSLLATRFLFGAGEAGAWPNVARTFSRWFPLAERGTVQGIFFMGAHLAGGVTPWLVQQMLGVIHWRTMFVMFGSIGFLWCILWYWWFRDEPSQHKDVTPEELALIEKGRPPKSGHHLDWNVWKKILSSTTVIALCGMYFTQSYGFMFYITWLPRYLKNERGFDAGALGLLAGLPLTLSVFADLFGGLTADWMSRRYGLRVGRAITGGGSLFLAGVFVVAGTRVADPWLSAVLIAIGGGLSAFLLGAAWGTILDVGGNHTGVVGAAMNTAGQVGAFICPILASHLVQWGYSWHAPLYVTGCLYMLGALCWFKIDPTKRVL